MYFYQPDTRHDEPALHALTELAERYPRYGSKKLFQLLRGQGYTGTKTCSPDLLSAETEFSPQGKTAVVCA